MVNLFIKNHKAILNAGPCLLLKEEGSPSPHQAYHHRNFEEFGYFSQLDTAHHYGVKIAPIRDKDNPAFSVQQFGATGGCEGIRLIKSGVDEGVRYLDYYANGVTAMCLDDAARVVFTGPLEGCFVAVGRAFNNTMLFHANDNKTKGGSEENTQNKIRLIRESTNGFFTCTLEELLMDKDYKHPTLPYRGFVYGIKSPDGDWDFYYHSIVLDGRWRIYKGSEPLPKM